MFRSINLKSPISKLLFLTIPTIGNIFFTTTSYAQTTPISVRVRLCEGKSTETTLNITNIDITKSKFWSHNKTQILDITASTPEDQVITIIKPKITVKILPNYIQENQIKLRLRLTTEDKKGNKIEWLGCITNTINKTTIISGITSLISNDTRTLLLDTQIGIPDNEETKEQPNIKKQPTITKDTLLEALHKKEAEINNITNIQPH